MSDPHHKTAEELVSRWVSGYAVNNTPALTADVSKALLEAEVRGLKTARKLASLYADVATAYKKSVEPAAAIGIINLITAKIQLLQGEE